MGQVHWVRTWDEDISARPSSGTPNYKTPEEYYDDILNLRKVRYYAVVIMSKHNEYNFFIL